MHTDKEIKFKDGLLTTVVYNGYGLEGSLSCAGAGVTWIIRLGLVKDLEDFCKFWSIHVEKVRKPRNKKVKALSLFLLLPVFWPHIGDLTREVR